MLHLVYYNRIFGYRMLGALLCEECEKYWVVSSIFPLDSLNLSVL